MTCRYCVPSASHQPGGGRTGRNKRIGIHILYRQYKERDEGRKERRGEERRGEERRKKRRGERRGEERRGKERRGEERKGEERRGEERKEERKGEERGGRYFDWWFPGDVGNEKVHGNVLAVHPLVHHLSDLLRHPVTVQITVVLQGGRVGRKEGERGKRMWEGRRTEGLFDGVVQ